MQAILLEFEMLIEDLISSLKLERKRFTRVVNLSTT